MYKKDETVVVDGKEPTMDEIRKYMEENPNLGYYTAREEWRNKAYGGYPPEGFRSWGDYWKSY